jgi:hypothetical protein
LNLIKEKENVINILQRENDNLNANNFKLNKDNMFLFSQNINLKKQLNNLNDTIRKQETEKKSAPSKNDLNQINLNPKIKNSMHNYKEYINQKQKKLPTDKILNIQRIIIESSLDKESSTLKQKFEKEKDKIINNKEKLLKEEDLNIASEVRKINKNITNIKECKKEIDAYGIIPITETLISIESRIDNQIKEIKTELEELQTLNEIVLTYTDDLMNLNRLLKKNLYATKLLYVIINKNPLFEKLSNVQQKYGEVFEMNIDQNEFENDSLENRDFINSKEYIDFLENMTPKEFKDNFNFIFNKRRKSNNRTLSSCKSLTYFRTTTANSMKRDKRIMLFKNNRLKKLQKITLKLNERISQIKIDPNKKEKNSKSTSVEEDKEKNKNNNQNNHLNNINKDNNK